MDMGDGVTHYVADEEIGLREEVADFNKWKRYAERQNLECNCTV